MMKTKSGFTIVELLIVIVVIAILAAISVVAYTGIQQRATNASIISEANQIIKSISGYIATNGSYPRINSGTVCIVPAKSSCTTGDTARPMSPALIDNLKTISTIASSIPDVNSDYNGITYDYASTRTFNGATQPVVIFYSLQGINKQCGLPNTTNSGGLVMSTSSPGYTVGDNNGQTICTISISGPAS